MNNNSIIIITIFVSLISFISGCGEDEDPKVITPNYVPIEVGNYWTFINPENPIGSETISITGQESCLMARLYLLVQQQMKTKMLI